MAAYTNRSVGVAFKKTKTSVTAAALATMIASSSVSAGWGDSAAGDELGNAKALGTETWARCAPHMADPNAKSYELSYLRSNTMPGSPFGVPLEYTFRGTVGLPGTLHAFNGETVTGEHAAQGTQMDALGHFGYLEKPWSGEGDFPSDEVKYFGGFSQDDVKPSAESPLLKLGIETVPPIVTSGILLDAKAAMGNGEALEAGVVITKADIDAMMSAQGMSERGILPGDAVFIHTGWGERWSDPAQDPEYYGMGPGLGYDAAQYLGKQGVVLVSLDNPFTDPVLRGQLQGKAGPAEGTPAGLPFAIHHHNLSQAGVLQIQNSRLRDIAADKVWSFCTMILPLRIDGGSGSPVRPVAIGASAG